VAVYTFVRTNVFGTLQIAFNGIGPTEARAGMIMLNTWMFFAPLAPMVILWAPLSPIDVIVLASAASVLLFLIVVTRRDARQLAREDPPPTDTADQ
jgi:hypothetical protein